MHPRGRNFPHKKNLPAALKLPLHPKRSEIPLPRSGSVQRVPNEKDSIEPARQEGSLCLMAVARASMLSAVERARFTVRRVPFAICFWL